MRAKIIKGWVIPSIKSVVDELKYLRDEFTQNKWDRAIEITKDGEVYGGLKPSLAHCCSPRSAAVGIHGGITYEELGFGYIHEDESDYKLRKMAKELIDNHIWIIENFE